MGIGDPRRFRPDRVPEHDRVVIHEYDPEWAEFFGVSVGLVRDLVGSHVGRIEHFGSTAVPGLAAKPVIDMLIQVPSTATATHVVMPRLVWGGLEAYWQSGLGYWFFIQRHPIRPHRTHHLHVAPSHHEIWNRIEFRDHLRTHTEVAARYGELKRRLAESFAYDREAYTEAKGAFIAEVIARMSESA